MKTIAVDIDDVLAANAEGFVEFSNQRWGTNLTPNDYDEHWAEVWNVDDLEAERRGVEFAQSGALGKYRAIVSADIVLRQLARDYKLVVVTSRRKIIAAESKAWLEEHFSGIFCEIHYAGIWDEHTPNRIVATKAEVIKEVGADYLIDDQLKHCLAVAEAGITGLLFGDYPWNQTESLPQNVVRVSGWEEVLSYFYEPR